MNEVKETRRHGQVNTVLLVVMGLFITIALIFVPIWLSLFSGFLGPSSAIDMLEHQGYVVFAAGEYDEINDKLDALKVSADAAVVAAESAVDAAETAVDNAVIAAAAATLAAEKVDLFNTAERFIYPSTTQITCTLVAGNTGVFGNWTLITDSGGGNFSSCFSTYTGYIVDMQIYDHSAVDKLYLVELSYGASKTILARAMWHTSFIDNVEIKSVLVPVGETLYYRMMSSGANLANAKVGFRYIYE